MTVAVQWEPMEDLVPHIHTFFDGAPELLIERELRETAIDFCQRSQVWQWSHDPLSAITGKRRYAVSPPRDTEIVEHISVVFLGRPQPPKTEEQLDLESPNWRDETFSGRGYVVEPDDFLFMLTRPSKRVTRALRVVMALKPALTVTSLPHILMHDWRDAMIYGAKARLYNMNEQSWYNPNEGRRYSLAYEARRIEAVAQRNKGNSRAEIQARGRRLGFGRGGCR